MTNLIEKAAQGTRQSEKSSLIERAADHMGADRSLSEADSIVNIPSPDHTDLVGSIGSTVDARACKFAKIDLTVGAAKKIAAPGGERSRVSEEFRIIKRQLLRRAFAEDGDAIRNGNLIMVTSAAPGEGKTFAAINLAMSIASERDHHVVLVNADFNKPGLVQELGIEADTGLIDILENDGADFSEVLIRTDIANLSVLPAGEPHRYGTELLASRNMGKLAGELADQYRDRVVIFDTSPVLATSEASALCAHVGQVLFVVEAEKTSEVTVRAALDLLSPCEHIGLILNKTGGFSAGSDFGSYYGSYRKYSKK